jgi:hypothetical protein
MISKPVVLGLLAAACVTAAAGGAYVAVRQNDSGVKSPATQSQAVQPAASPGVAETEAIVSPASSPAAAREKKLDSPRADQPRPSQPRIQDVEASAPKNTPPRTTRPDADRTPSRTNGHAEATPTAERAPATREPATTVAPAPTPVQPIPEPAIPEPPAPPARQFVEVVVPASSVLGLKVETPLSSETAKVEDRVEARVTRDVMADGRVAIPSGARVIGDVVDVDRGGKMKGKARLGVRFHTIVLDGTQVSLRTDPIVREGQSPGNESARKIGGAAIGGAVLGAIMGGAKGAAIGGATGAAGGSAVVMAGDRNAATIPAGTIVTVRLASSVAVDVEKDPQ